MKRTADDAALERLRFLSEVVERESAHLQRTDARLFAVPMTAQRVATMEADVALSEQVDAFVGRFGRLQDTVTDKLIPALLAVLAETPGAVLDNLNRAERLGWLSSADHWLALRKLRDRMADEDLRDADVLAAALSAAHAGVPLLCAAASALVDEARRRTAGDPAG